MVWYRMVQIGPRQTNKRSCYLMPYGLHCVMFLNRLRALPYNSYQYSSTFEQLLTSCGNGFTVFHVDSIWFSMVRAPIRVSSSLESTPPSSSAEELARNTCVPR